MDCQGFKKWLSTRDGCDAQTSRQARAHREDCTPCERLYVADEGLEQALASGIRTAKTPVGMAQRARALAGEQTEPTTTARPTWFRMGLAPALALGLALVFVVWNPFANPLTSLEVIGNYALANHNRADVAMAFTADDIPDPQDWFFERLKFNVMLPDLHQRGLIFKGGRECTIGPKKAAYLYYDDSGKHVSVFVFPARHVSIPLQADRHYLIDAPRYSVELWKTGTMVCILVQDRDTGAPSKI